MSGVPPLGDAHYRRLVETSPYGICTLDAEGRYLQVNSALARILGSSPADLLGRHFAARVFPADREIVALRLRRLLAGERAEAEVETRLLHSSGVERRVHLRAVPIVAAERMTAIHVVARDLTEEGSREVRLRRAERLASLGTLLSGVAHELNNPLASIKSFAQLLLLDERPTDDREALQIIEQEATRAARIVADLRLVARQTRRRESGVRGPVQLNEVVRQVLELRGYTLATHNIKVDRDLAAHLPVVHADPGEMEQVILNLVLNAEHSMATHPGERRLLVRTRPSLRGVTVQVVDSGPGIPAEHLDRIFDPFWTTKEPGEGTGLGLSMTYSIVMEHGGEIRVESRPGEGAAFTVELPSEPVSPMVPPPELGAARSPALRVLVVDDEAPIRQAVARYLQRRGHYVDQAADGREALDRLEEAPYDAIVADLRMPGLSGERFLAELRERHPGAERRLLFITGDALSESVPGVITGSAIPVIYKPFEMEQIAREVEERGASADRGAEGAAPPMD
ncbi:MAG TPA: ATP-binding protein [Longimicrobiaceae bacterium]|nr:ATP-binding protein [Longimicrobiaceae bacterium]